MYKFSIAPSEYLASSFESKLNMCDRTGCAYVEISDIVEKQFLGDMDGDKIESMRNLLIDYGKTISLVTYTGNLSDKERFKKLLRTAHLLHVKAIKVGCCGYTDIDDCFYGVGVGERACFRKNGGGDSRRCRYRYKRRSSNYDQI